MDKKFDHLLVEKNTNKKWIDKKFFSSHDKNKKEFSIIMPPPNVTGKLHLGHAWDGYLQDAIIRYKKIQDFDVLFLPGTDHAGIATQAKVLERMYELGIDPSNITKELFLEYAHNWKDEYSNSIKEQWSYLGLALDYTNERFTLDKSSNDAVNEVFIDMYKKNLIYRSNSPINWDPILKTALSNIEVVNKETDSLMYYIKYYLENSDEFIVIATTRPETIFSDVAIGINDNDKDKFHLLNKNVINPITKELIPVIKDEYIDKDFETGFMKVSAHATADIEIINKNNLKIKECIDTSGMMRDHTLFVSGLSREEARKKIEIFLNENDLLVKTKKIINNVSYSERSNAVIEILVKEQWFVKMEPLSKKVLEHLKSKDKVNIFPNRFEQVLKKWMENVHDWNISRQLWWGHQIPAWFNDNGEIIVQQESPGPEWKQDQDVLDTWFSSALCPFSFLGWPNEKFNDLNRFFPTNLLVTGYDIIFFWVARMYFQSLEFMNEKPFNDLLIHGLIRDENGKKMSKSLGNGIDPIAVIKKYGSDSLRWYLLTNSTPGYDINFSYQKLESAWSLINKLWNIARFIEQKEANDINKLSDADNWIISKFNSLKKILDIKINTYEFTIIGKEVSNFIYNDFSSWYIEFSKEKYNKVVALNILKNLLILIHPFLPFVTDYLHLKIFDQELLESKFNVLETSKDTSYIDRAINVIVSLRNFRHKFSISKNVVLKYMIEDKYKDENLTNLINSIINAEHTKVEGSIIVVDEMKINIELPQEFKNKEISRLESEISRLESEIERSNNILNNKNFVNKAPKEKLDIEIKKYENYKMELETYQNELKGLK